MSDERPAPPETSRHIGKIQDRLIELLSGLSGLRPEGIDPEATFLELGFESLSLTQLTVALKKEFAVEVGHRDLMESHRTPRSLAERLARELPEETIDDGLPPSTDAGSEADAKAEARRTPKTNDRPAETRRPGSGVPSSRSGARDIPSSVVEEVILEQIRMMNHQLDLLRGSTGSDDVGLSDEAPAAPAVEAPPVDRKRGSGAGAAPSDGEARHGPWRPMSETGDDTLSRRQRAHIRELVDRVEERMPTSKRLTQEHRRHLADPRSVEGFRRAWKEVVHPVVAERSEGAYIWDVDGNRYVDIAMGFGVALLGHHPPFVRRALRERLEQGWAIGPQTPLAGEVARLVHEMTGMERVAFCNTGSEAVLAAVRTARTVTGRERIATFRGDYHGIFDEMLARGVEIDGERTTMPISPGIPPRMVEAVTMLDYGDDASLEVIREEADELAAVLVEPVQSRHPGLQPADFLRRLRALTEELDVPLILDEMITGFRSHPGGIQALWDVRADLATYGKVVGGGMPIGVVAGKARFLDALDGGHWRYGDESIPEAGMTWFAGTFVRHPLSLAAARATLEHLQERGGALQAELSRRTAAFVDELNRRFERMGAPLHAESFASFFLVKFEEAADAESLLYFNLRARGVHVTEGRAAFLSTAHTEEDVAFVLDAFTESVRALQEGGFLPGGPAETLQTEEAGVEVQELPLTEGQKEIWLATRMGDDANCAFNLSHAIRLEGDLDADALREAVRRLVPRHEALRTTFAAEGPTQRIRPAGEVELEVPRIDLADHGPAEREERLERLRREEVETPFDLERGPLVRARLVRLAPDDHVLFLTVHHIVCDGWSCGVLLRDLGTLYPALRDRRQPDLPEPTQLGEYVRMDRYTRNGPKGREAEEYWLERLRDGAPVVELPTDRPRPPRKTYDADRVELGLGLERHAEIKAAAAQRDATPFAFLYAAFETLMHRLTGQEELLLGVSAAGQPTVGARDLVGHCVNVLPVRNRVEGEGDFAAHLDRTRTLLLDGFDHQGCTIGSLIEKLDLDRDPSRLPLVSVVFNLDPTLAELDFGGPRVSARSNPRSHEIFDLFFNVVVAPDDFRLECTFNSDILDRETVSAWLEHYRTLLDEVVSDPDRPVDRLPLLSETRRARLLEEWNETAADYPTGLCVHQMVERQVDRTPEAVAVQLGSETLTYRALDERANRLAGHLQRHGVGPEDRVGVLLERSPEMVVALLGVMKAGGAYVPMAPEDPAERLEYMAEDAGVRVIVTRAESGGRLPDLGVPVVDLDVDRSEIEARSSDRPTGPVDETNLAYIIYTSGSTGRPKGVMVEHRHIRNRLQWGSEAFPLGADDTVLQKTPFGFDVSVPEFFWTLSSGARLLLAGPGGHRDPGYLADLIEEEGVSYVHFVPSMLEVFLDEDDLERRCRSLRWVACSGEALSYEHTRRFRERMPPGVELHNLYGPTETAVEVSRWIVPDEPDDRSVPIGRPIANTRLYVLDRHMEPVPVGVAGELYVGGAQVVRGYRNRPELTADHFVKDPFSDDAGARLYRTGDRTRWRPDGTIEFLGRLDHQVKLRGFRIEPGEIESVLAASDGVRQATVVLRNGGGSDPELVAYVVPETGRSVVAEGLRSSLAQRLPDYMIPARFAILDELPLTPSGKVDRSALPEPTAAELSRRPSSPPGTDTERALAEAWSSLLDVADIGREDSFFDLGGHSLMATRLLGRIADMFDVDLPLRAVFEHPTLAGLAGRIDDARHPDLQEVTI